jgi:hypothetical protein
MSYLPMFISIKAVYAIWSVAYHFPSHVQCYRNHERQ